METNNFNFFTLLHSREPLGFVMIEKKHVADLAMQNEKMKKIRLILLPEIL